MQSISLEEFIGNNTKKVLYGTASDLPTRDDLKPFKEFNLAFTKAILKLKQETEGGETRNLYLDICDFASARLVETVESAYLRREQFEDYCHQTPRRINADEER